MEITSKSIIFENQREMDIFQELLRECNIRGLQQEKQVQAGLMLANIIQGLWRYDEESPR